jgi:hypothetical protein
MSALFVNETVKPCFNFTELNCLYEENIKFYSQKELYEAEKECPLECNTVNYITQSSSISYPSRSYFKLLKTSAVVAQHYSGNASESTLTYEDLKSKVVYVNLHYRAHAQSTWFQFLSS